MKRSVNSFNRLLFRTLPFLLFALPILAGDLEARLFADISRQSHDYSCGPAALSTLINGTAEGAPVSEMDVILTRGDPSQDGREEGFSLLDLQQAAEKLGYRAKWRKIRPESVLRISRPVVLLTGLNSPFPHFVILKGFRDREAFLADPTRGNIRVGYDDLVEEGINEKYPAWYVMAINMPALPKEGSLLYLSDSKSDLYNTHFTTEQSDAITMVVLPRTHQVFVTYGYTLSQGRDHGDGYTTKSHGDTHSLDVSYGISDDMELGAGLSDSNTTYTYSIPGYSSIEVSDRSAYLSISRDFEIGAGGDMGVLASSTLSYREEYGAWNAGLGALLYTGTDWGQLMARGSFYKKIREKAPGDLLPEYGISWLLGINKPLSNRYLGTFYLTMDSDHYDDTGLHHFYSANANLSWALNKRIQLRPSVGYSFGHGVMKTFYTGMEVTYVGGW